MAIDSITLYKFMILYMLNKVNFPLTNNQMQSFFLDKDYTNYFVFQEVIKDLLDAELITSDTVRNTSYYKITESGVETIELFTNKIPVAIIDEIDIFLIDNKYEMRNEVGTTSDYYISSNGTDYIVTCKINEGNLNMIDLNLTVPSEDVAEIMCSNWKDACQDIYATIMKTLMKRKKDSSSNDTNTNE